VPSNFVHLRLHTEFSLRDGLLRIPAMIARAKEYEMPALAISDHTNLCGMVKFYTKAMAQGVKPIIAADVIIHEGDDHFLATLYCQNQEGYQSLTWLLSEAYLKGQEQNGEPELQRDWIEGHSEGLIVLSGGRFGDIGQALIADKKDLATQRLQWWEQHFPNRHYIELTRTGRPQEELYVHAAVELALQNNVPVVATNDVRFLEKDDFEAHEARVCIHDSYVLEDKNRPRRYSEAQYLKSPQEMTELFSDIPEAIENTVEIAKRCTVKVRLGEAFLPQYPVPEGFTTETYLEDISFKGLRNFLNTKDFTPEIIKEYEDRLQLELDVINQMGFPGYFLIVADFIGWAKENKIPVGPGRGSGAGSLVAFALRITTLDPIEHELLFERFLNPERVSMPDFDIDFCMERRDLVIDYVARRYGRDAVSQIITYGTMAAKAVVRDVGRVLGRPYGFCDKLAKLIPFEIGMTLEKAMQQEEELARRYREDEETTTLIDLALKLEGITRNAGKHAGGVVIAPGKLTDFTPLYCEAGGGNLVTQFDKNDVESVGLVKFDFLGLRTLTIIDWALQTINKRREQQSLEPIDIETIPTDDAQTFKLLQNCETTAVFQLESRGMKELVKRLRPDSFDEITALVALFRPGPLQSGMVDDFIDRKHGRSPVHYPHADIEDILKPTYGVILYQEQVMQIAQVLANYTLGGADVLRRAMGKKKPEEMAKQRSIFTEGAVGRGIDADIAEHIFDLMEKFAGYGFNKSHSAAYALIAYQTAWLKAHYPAEFMAAVLSSDMDNTDKVVGFVAECDRMKLKVIPPSINSGDYMFTVDDEGQVIYGLGAIKGVGQAAIEHVVEEREANGPYTHLYEFCQRLDAHKINRRVLEALIKSGALDTFKVNRATLFASINCAIKAADQKAKADSIGQDDLFGGTSVSETEVDIEYVKMDTWPDQEKLQYEKDTLGMYISGHPFKSYQKELSRVTSCFLGALSSRRRREATVAGMMVAQRMVITKTGRRMGIVKLEDQSGDIEITLFSRLYEEVREKLVSDSILIVKGKIEDDKFTGGVRMVADTITTIAELRTQQVKKLILSVADEGEIQAILTALPNIIKSYAGACPIAVRYQSKDAKAELNLGAEWRVNPREEVLTELKKIFGKNAVNFEYS
jgi:DNA polymerase-3 subunit alpha